MEERYYIIDLERTIKNDRVYYWKAARRGYTTDLAEAGLYSKAEAEDLVKSDFDHFTVCISQLKRQDLAGH